MTISSDIRTAGPFTGTGLVSVYAFAFKVFAAAEVVATSTNTSGVLTTLTQPTHYTVTLNSNQNTSPGGTITLAAPLASGFRLEIGSEIAATQGASLPNQGGWFPAVVEDALDRLTILAQQMGGGTSNRNLRVPELGGIDDLPSISDRAGKLMSFNGITGAPEAVAAADQSATQLAIDLASSASGKGATLVGLEDAGGYYTGTQVESVLQDVGARNARRPYVTDIQFGAVGDLNPSTGVGTDNTAAFNLAAQYAIQHGVRVFVPAGIYKVTGPILFNNSDFRFSGGFEGESGNSTRIYYYNTTPLQNLFTVGADVNYLSISNLEFIDANARTSRCVYFSDNDSNPSVPSWKHEFRNVRIVAFAEGCRFDGGATPSNDTHESEVMFLHSKFRNCAASLIYNNIQAVNHQLIGLDIENDDAADAAGKWPMIVFERGSYVNHTGGSVIGYGPYIKFTYPSTSGSAFQATTQASSTGVRLEARGDGPFFSHDTSSNITLSHFFRVLVRGLSVSNTLGTTPVLATAGGRVLYHFEKCNANTTMLVQAYMTSNLNSNQNVGAIRIDDCKNIVYARVSGTSAYGGTGVAGTVLRSIPAEVRLQNETINGQNDGDGYFSLNNFQQTIYSGSWQTASPKTLVYAPVDTAGIGSGVNPSTTQINLPAMARPYKFRLLRNRVNAASAFVLDLYFVVSGVDVLVATITPTVNIGGHFEAEIQSNAGLINYVNDGVAWDGKMKVVKSGTVNGYVGLVMIDYM